MSLGRMPIGNLPGTGSEDGVAVPPDRGEPSRWRTRLSWLAGAMGLAALILIVRTSSKAGQDVMRLAVAFVVFTSYFCVIIALAQPRYLQLLPRMLHPHGLFEPATRRS